jgi:hypothetical protein
MLGAGGFSFDVVAFLLLRKLPIYHFPRAIIGALIGALIVLYVSFDGKKVSSSVGFGF